MPKCLLELLGLLLELLMELPLLLLDALHHVLILWGRERPPYNYHGRPRTLTEQFLRFLRFSTFQVS